MRSRSRRRDALPQALICHAPFSGLQVSLLDYNFSSHLEGGLFSHATV